MEQRDPRGMPNVNPQTRARYKNKDSRDEARVRVAQAGNPQEFEDNGSQEEQFQGRPNQ